MVSKAQAERMLSTEERALLELCARGPDAYPILELVSPTEGVRWIWEYGPLGAPREYDTKAEAVHNLELQLGVLRDAERVERERRYGGAAPPASAARAIAEPADG
jgi:hypothetical protein